MSSHERKKLKNTVQFNSRSRTKENELVRYKMAEINRISLMTIEELPTEILSRILQDLSPIDRLRSEQVCRKWRDISRQTWKDIKTLYIMESINPNYELIRKRDNHLFIFSDSPRIIHCLVSRVGCFIEKLIIDFVTGHFAAILTIIIFYCQNLKILFLHGDRGGRTDEELLSLLFEGNQELHSVMCRNVRNFIKALPLRNWRSLRFPESGIGSEEKIIKLIEHSEALEEFEINTFTLRIKEVLLNHRNFNNLYCIASSNGLSPEMVSDVPFSNQLRDLKLDIDNSMLTDNLLSSMLQHCSQLKRLSITCLSCQEFSLTILQKILAHPTLETLRIECNMMTSDILINLTKFKNLSITNGDENVNIDILKIIKMSEFLENLDLSSIHHVRPELFEELVREMKNRKKYLNIMVRNEIFDEVSRICTGSKIRLVEYMQCFNRWSY